MKANTRGLRSAIVLAGALVLLCLLAAAYWITAVQPARADPNELHISPSAVEVAPGDSVTVSLVADPPAATLTVWAIDVRFDPDVVATDTLGCDVLDPLPNSTAIGACPVSASGSGPADTVKVLGGLVFTRTEDGHEAGDGLGEETVLADITFEAVGEPGACSELRLLTLYHIDVDGDETGPLLFDGRICIEQDAPPSGTAVPHTPAPRTSDPTPTGDAQVTPFDFDPVTEPGATDGQGGPDGAGGTAGSSPDDGASPRSPRTEGGTTTSGAGGGNNSEDGDDDGGSGVVFWLLIGLGGLIVVAAVAWAVVRNFSGGSGPPEEPPPDA